LLTRYAGDFAGKTGFTNLARKTYVGAAQRNGRRLVVVEMYGSGDLYDQAIGLFDWGFQPVAAGSSANARTGKGTETLDCGRRCGEPGAPRRQVAQVGEVLDDVHARTEQQRVRWAFTSRLGVVDVDRVDPDQRRARVDEVLGAVSGEKWCADAVIRPIRSAGPSRCAGARRHLPRPDRRGSPRGCRAAPAFHASCKWKTSRVDRPASRVEPGQVAAVGVR